MLCISVLRRHPSKFVGCITEEEKKVTTVEENGEDWDWERWKQHFTEIEEHEKLVSVLKSQLNEAILREDYGEAAKLKLAITGATKKDIVGAALTIMNRAIEEEPYSDAAFICDHVGAGLVNLEIPLENAYIVLETDGSIIGWGGVCKWKPNKYDPINMEKVCAHAHGKFPLVKSVMDAEIYATMETMTALKIHYMDKLEITLRTDLKETNILAVITEEGKVAFGPTTLTDVEEEAACSSRFPLLTEYEDLISDTFSKNFLKEEHEKRNRMAKIEDEAIGNVLECLRELELILQMKEFDFNRRRHAEGG
ncbi:hypothetical protein ZIOFF_069864 [Zingiber officinale]|uniref:Uncharacterized protein n=1 Tax=Zingiber officinale TaxID=94328 RepID=A0A8J5ED48_ZINOF|nr:hypothetical protein ZIOFF_069864 [Zingiber officinale]